jgi:hypothetical protein
MREIRVPLGRWRVGLTVLVALMALSTRLEAVTGRILGTGYIENAQTNVNNAFNFPAANFNFKFCTDANGQNCPFDLRGVTNSQGMMDITHHSPSGLYFLFAWKDDILWGSTSQPAMLYSYAIGTSDYPDWYQIIGNWWTRPRPLPPTMIAPLNGATVYTSPCGQALSWTDGLDSARRRADWKASYDLYLGANGAYTLVAANLTSPAFNGSLPIQPNNAYSWAVVAKLEVLTGLKYTTPSTAAFTFNAATPPTPVAPSSFPPDRVWVEDAVPSGGIQRNLWIWDTVQKASGSQSHTDPAATADHQHYFDSATPFFVASGEKLVTYVLLDACNPPKEVMFQWFDGSSWEHRAYWGPDLLQWGVRQSIGPLPALGQWVRLEVPADTVGLGGRYISGMAFSLFGGKAWFDRSGVVPIPVDDAVFARRTPPPSPMVTGSTASVSVTMRNTGTTIWDSTYRLGSQNPQDNGTWGLGRVFLAPGETVIPGAEKTFSFNVTAPLTPGTYNFQWRMVHELVRWFGDYSSNVAVSVVSQGPPAAPTGLNPNGSTISSSSVTLAWTPTPGATKYAVRLQDLTDGSLRSTWTCPGTPNIYLCVNDITSNSYVVSVVAGHSYSWWVHAGNSAGYGPPSYASFNVAVVPPAAPTGLTPNGTALADGATSATLSWTPTPGATKYAVRLRDDTDGSLRSTWTCPGTPTIYLCVNDIVSNSYSAAVVPGHSYTWWVHAGNNAGYGVPTYASFSVPLAGPPAPPVGMTPNGVSLPAGSTSVTLRWTPTPGATKYAVRLRDDTDGTLRSTWTCPGTPTIYLCVNDITPNSYTSTVVPGHSYTWWMHAGNNYGYSAPTYASFSVP